MPNPQAIFNAIRDQMLPLTAERGGRGVMAIPGTNRSLDPLGFIGVASDLAMPEKAPAAAGATAAGVKLAALLGLRPLRTTPRAGGRIINKSYEVFAGPKELGTKLSAGRRLTRAEEAQTAKLPLFTSKARDGRVVEIDVLGHYFDEGQGAEDVGKLGALGMRDVLKVIADDNPDARWASFGHAGGAARNPRSMQAVGVDLKAAREGRFRDMFIYSADDILRRYDKPGITEKMAIKANQKAEQALDFNTDLMVSHRVRQNAARNIVE